ncbi:hypothetical protein BU23DRAFT_462440, partial [Bimuria novae-zelandiae CBS 107.79]
LPTKLAPRYLEGTLLYVIKLLYRIAKVGITYYRYYYEKLDIFTLIYKLCLLVINSNVDNFSIISV